MGFVSKGLGIVENPQVYFKLSFEQFKEAFQFEANYRNMAPEDREQALNEDYRAIQSFNKKAEKSKD